jgi:hypothetical protein
MSVTYIPFESKSGFKSPGFLVNELGDLIVTGSITVSGNISTTGDFEINGIPVIDASDSTISLSEIIRYSYLTRVGTLEFLNIDGDFTVAQGSTPYINIVNGNVFIQSANDVGSIDNIDIGLREPADANFKSVNIGPGDSSGELTVQGIASVEDLEVSGTTAITGVVTLGASPTANNHATRKDYVDSRVTAFAIAFGA